MEETAAGWLLSPGSVTINNKNIGAGNFGSVYEADCLGTPVAVKVMNTLPQEASSSNEDLQREVDALLYASHPCIVRCLGVCVKDNKFHLVMELGAVGSLMMNLYHPLTKGTMNLHQKFSVIHQIAQAMAFLHHFKGIMHRDLKPANVLLQAGNGRPGDYSVRLCDFGLARKLEGTDGNLTFDRGTASYIAPEILAGKKYFFSADVYSFGIMMWEIMMETPPRRMGPLDGFSFKAGSRPPTVPQSLWDLLSECTDAEPSCRPNFLEILDELVQLKKDIQQHQQQQQQQQQSEQPPQQESKPKKQRASDRGIKILDKGMEWRIDPDLLIMGESLRCRSISKICRGIFLGTPVSVKMLSLADEEGEKQLVHFQREMNVLLQTSHPNIIRFLGVVVDEKEIKIVTEYAEGGDLRQRLFDMERPALSLYEKAHIMIQVAQAISYLHHAKGVMHRALATDHVLLKGGAEGLSVRLTNFYKARPVVDGQMTNLLLDHPFYAPEMWTHNYGYPADIFAFGVILWQVLTEKERPLRVGAELAFIPGDKPEDVPQKLWDLMLHCVAAKAEERPKVFEVIERLKAIAETDIGPPASGATGQKRVTKKKAHSESRHRSKDPRHKHRHRHPSSPRHRSSSEQKHSATTPPASSSPTSLSKPARTENEGKNE